MPMVQMPNDFTTSATAPFSSTLNAPMMARRVNNRVRPYRAAERPRMLAARLAGMVELALREEPVVALASTALVTPTNQMTKILAQVLEHQWAPALAE